MGFFSKFDAKKQEQEEVKTTHEEISDEAIEMIFIEIKELRKIIETNRAELKLTTELVGKLSLEIKELQKEKSEKE